MITAFDLFLITGPSVQAIFRLGFIPRDEDYREMTEEELNGYKQTFPEVKEKMYILQTEGKDVENNGLSCISESERAMLAQDANTVATIWQRRSSTTTK